MSALSAVLLVILMAGCGRGERAVETDGPIKVSSMPIESPAGAASFVPTLEGPLRLIAATPAGGTDVPPSEIVISVTFSRPMVPLGEAPDPEPTMLDIDPQVPGDLRWEGTQTLVFTPDRPLKKATRYRVTIPEGTAATDGEALGAPESWAFETVRPSVASSRPTREARFASPDSILHLVFNQSVRPASVAGAVSLHLLDERRRRGRTADVSVEAESDSSFRVVPAAPLERGTWYELVVGPDLRSAEGPLESGREESVTFRTTPPLRFEGVTQDRGRIAPDTETLDPGRGLVLEFSTPVRFGDLRRALSIEPALDLPPGLDARDAAVSLTHAFPVDLLPETAYTVRIDSLRDSLEQLLTGAERTFRTGAFRPSFSIPRGFMVLEAGGNDALALRSTNVERMRIGATRLTADELVPMAPVYDDGHYYPQAEGEPDGGAGTPDPVPADRIVDLDIPRNRSVVVPVGFDSLLTEGTGILGIHVRPQIPGASAGQQTAFRALLQVTDLGVTGKFSAHQNLILVTRLATAQPVEGARVSIRGADNSVYWTGTTDDHGRAETPGWSALGMEQPNQWSAPVQFAVVESGTDLAFTASNYMDGIEPYRFNIPYRWQPDPVTWEGTLFTDRGLYRAGETVHAKAILRKRSDRAWQSVRDSVRVLVMDPRSQIVLDRRFLPGEFGTFNFDWTPPEGAAQGQYAVRVYEAGSFPATPENFYGITPIGTGSFRVDAFRRATFDVQARSAAPEYVAGDFFEGSISGRYLFGSPMQGQPVSYTLERRPGSFRPPGYDGFVFGTYGWFSGVYRTIVQADSVLGDDGHLEIRTPVPGNDQGAVASLDWAATVTDPARQQGTGRTALTLHPGLFYIGLKPRTTYLSVDESDTMPVDLITVTPDGHPVGDREITVTLIRRQWNSVREIGADGRLRWRSERIEETIAEQQMISQAGRSLRLELPVEQGGSYVIRAASRDVRGNRVATEAYFHASGPGYTAWERRDDDRIELIPDRSSYRPGDTARLMVLSPYEEATALITVEREGILSSRVETLTGSAPEIEIQLGEEHLPNAFVSVVLLGGRTAQPSAGSDVGAPSFRIGYANLPVDAGGRHLVVDIETDETEYRPGDEVTVDFRLLNPEGEGVPGEIAFSAADAGVLNLIGYALPDPFERFYGPRSLGVVTTEARANLVRQRNFGQKEEDQGGGGGDEDAAMRQDFRPLAHWEPALLTDARGRARLTFRLPESLTTFRLMAVAVTEDHAFGAGRTEIVVNKPLVLQPALPRFVRPGDRFEAGVLVTNRTTEAGTVTVTAAAEGLELVGDSTRSIQIGIGETREVRFDWRADGARAARSDTARVAFTAQLGRETDALGVELPVNRPVISRASAVLASTDDEITETLRVPEDHVPGLGGLQIRVSSTALVGLEGAAEYLFTYPWGCLEQRTSAVRPLILGDDLIDLFDLEVLDGSREEVVSAWAGDLRGFLAGDGFAMWPGGYVANPWVSGYTVLAMAEAKRAGVEIPDDLLLRVLDDLERRVRARSERPAFYPAAAWTRTRALMLFALASHDRILPGEIDALASDVVAGRSDIGADGESLLIRAILLASVPALRTHLDPLVVRLRNRIVVEGASAHLRASDAPGMGWIFGSDVRSTAFGLTALIEAEEADEIRLIAERMIRYLIDSRTRGAWASTQENAAVIEAFATYVRAFEEEDPDFSAEVRMAGRTILEHAFRGRSLDAVAADLAVDELPSDRTVPVQFSKTGTGRLYYSMRLQTYTTAAVEAESRGLTVERRIQLIDEAGRPVGPERLTGSDPLELAPGQMVRVVIRLSSASDRNYVVVEDALPAGLEALNTAFETTNRNVVEEARSDVENRWWGSFNHTEIQDDRVVLFADFLDNGTHTYVYVARATTPGTFRYPPVQAELMYRPETGGRTSSGTLVVREPVD